MAEILRYCVLQKAKTKIMYKINVNCTQLERYLRSLLSQGLLATNKNKYTTTQKWHRFLELFVQLSEIINC
jgi:predicted transcriptional regulator